MRAVRKTALIAGIGLILASACSPPAEKNTSPSAEVQAEAEAAAAAVRATANQIKPETIVTFPKGQIACLTEEVLQSALQDGLAGRETKMNRHFEGDGGCVMLDPSKSYKVIDAHYRSDELPDAAILEIVGEEITAAEQGAYVLILDRSLITVVKEPSGQ